jgi:hypothetical protein
VTLGGVSLFFGIDSISTTSCITAVIYGKFSVSSKVGRYPGDSARRSINRFAFGSVACYRDKLAVLRVLARIELFLTTLYRLYFLRDIAM